MCLKTQEDKKIENTMRIVFFIVSIIAGIIFGYILIAIYSLFLIVFFRIGDSSPEWFIPINQAITYLIFVIGLMFSLYIFRTKIFKNKKWLHNTKMKADD
jgi:hypothetical protein